MNGLLQNDTGTDGANPPVFTPAHVNALLNGALKSPKVVAGAERGVFDIDCDDVENFFHLIDQRVNEQQTCLIDKFEVSIFFNNGTSTQLNGIEEFRSYAQVKNIAATVISFHWTLLLEFPNAMAHEKQEIDIVLRASDIPQETIDIETTHDSMRMSGDKFQIKFGPEKSSYGIVTYSINHTRISWGLDIENVIQSHISKILVKASRSDKALKHISGPLNLFTTVFVGLYIVNILIELFFYFLLSSEDASTQKDLIEIASLSLVNGDIAKYIVVSLTMAVVVFVMFSALVSHAFNNFLKPKPSFITLSKFDEKRRSAKLKKYKKRWAFVSLVLFSNIVVAIIIATVEERMRKFFEAVLPFL